MGRLEIENDPGGVRLWLAVSGQPDTDVMVFGQEPCSPGRHKRRNVCYLGLLPLAGGGRCEITYLYKARFGEPRPNTKVFIVTSQTKDGWKGMDRETNARVPEPPSGQQTPALAALPLTPYMHKGCTRDAEGKGWPPTSQPVEGPKPVEGGGKAAGAAIGGAGGGGEADGASG